MDAHCKISSGTAAIKEKAMNDEEAQEDDSEVEDENGLFTHAELDREYLEKISLLSRLEDWRFLVNSYQRTSEERQQLVAGMLDDQGNT